MNPFEFVLIIIAMVFGFTLLKNRLAARGDWHLQKGEGGAAEDSAETLRLREEVAELKERIKVLERITVDKENSLARQIEELRDR
ncbi:MAG: hypothetical protein M3Y43_10050 [Pseudomonadota bacterium]|nr:hypothetical protein [Pseudomonadota bacterium]